MTSTRRSVWIPHNHVCVDNGLSLIECNIAAHPNNLVLSVDGDFLVHLAVGIGARLIALIIVIVAIGIALLGPGAYSVDSYLFGRREIVIPPRLPEP